MFIGFAAYGQSTYVVECKGVEAVCGDFWLDSVTADTIQVKVVAMNDKSVIIPGTIERMSDTVYYTGSTLIKDIRSKIKLDLTGFKRDAYLIRLVDENVFGILKSNKLVVKS